MRNPMILNRLLNHGKNLACLPLQRHRA